MNNKLAKLFITILTILASGLIAGYLINYTDTYYKGKNMYRNVAYGMLIMVLVYYPMTTILDAYFQRLSKKVMGKSKKIAKSNLLGMLIGFCIAIFVLFIGYAKFWYNFNVLENLWDKYIV